MKTMRMPLAPQPSGLSTIPIELTEWADVTPTQDPCLKGTSLRSDLAAQQMVRSLGERVKIKEGFHGLEISTTSFVGYVEVGPLRLSIRPKLPDMPLAVLLRYAYGLRDLTFFEEAPVPTAHGGLQDLLIAMLADEVEELLHGGLARRYVPIEDSLENLRGRILFDRLARQGGVREARLPCHYFERDANWHLNQVLRAGLDTAADMSSDRDLRRRVCRLANLFGEVDRKSNLNRKEIERAERGLTRLTEANRPALTIIRLLHDMLGVGFTAHLEASRMHGFLFDMNKFFQRLLLRFLNDNLTSAQIQHERPIRDIFSYAPDANPRRRIAQPRPDYALFRAKTLRGFLDAKYRDLWEKSLPADWLYQLSIYALSSPTRVSIILYASMASEGSDERVEIRPPAVWPGNGSATVIVRPVSLLRLRELIGGDRSAKPAVERRRWAEELVRLDSSVTAATRVA
jgi:5-methylcytosine-specific restriction enzyme subunit McrC